MDKLSLIIISGFSIAIIKVTVAGSLYWGCGGGRGAGPETWPKHFWGSPAENVENPWPIVQYRLFTNAGVCCKEGPED